jgi:hypothetical protein
MCHCLECQRRTGAVISNQARFRRGQVTFTGKDGVDTDSRKRQRTDLSFLSDMRLHRLLGGRTGVFRRFPLAARCSLLSGSLR